ncbi:MULTISPECIES: hypothetical protein [Pasteurellaceae]|uniref:Uncharacterized protein n=1 Tax=Pasteurella atlantica TaxID=2827233 RepID=A0AAW8CK41_9PAST|nr:hypothetical protein [Pasteurella atlantica]MBR0574473.1 hypothetical protein [Pasteurella atlantica]MDP8039351.1 hypothetical protein [Pasteurella atlantica]MDP8041443.1 hypothetical protein [Pasteurella atlantica]MDP8043632.1 hypothetical protein [Pasteurella atlantica]MDP8045664.1 hypothetical protein [Pasteurella atlantica]
MKELNIKNIDFKLPIEVVAFQYSESCPTMQERLNNIEPIFISGHSISVFMDWLLNGKTKNYWKQYLEDMQCTYIDSETKKSPFCIIMPLVVFRFEFCQWGIDCSNEETQLLLHTLFEKTKDWKNKEVDLISINLYFNT